MVKRPLTHSSTELLADAHLLSHICSFTAADRTSIYELDAPIYGAVGDDITDPGIMFDGRIKSSTRTPVRFCYHLR